MTKALSDDTDSPPREKPSSAPANPNAASLKSRKNYRPRKRNTPVEKKTEAKMNWVEPLRVPIPPHFRPFAASQKHEYVGSIALNLHSVDLITQPLLSVLEHVGDTTNQQRYFDVMKHLRSVAFLMVAKQIYTAASDLEKSALQPVKSVFYWNPSLPDRMVDLCAIYGDVNTRIGRFKVAHTQHTFHRLIEIAGRIQALTFNQILDAHSTANLIDNVGTLVWDLDDAPTIIKSHARDIIDVQRNLSFDCRIPNNAAQVSIPEPAPTDDFTSYLAKISPLIGDTTSRRIATVVHLHNNPTFSVLRSLTTRDNAPENSDPTLIQLRTDAGNVAQRHRMVVANSQKMQQALLSPWMHSIFHLKPMASSENGTAAQMVIRSEARYHYEAPFPLSDSDAFVGIALQPAVRVTFDTTEVIRLSESLSHLRASMMESSIRASER